jgi:heme-degrading monooxygenase HmoA
MKTPIYVIVCFDLRAGELDVLAPLIEEFFQKEVSAVPGFMSAKLHTNDERTVLINYATWKSMDAFQRFMNEVAANSAVSKKIQQFSAKTDVVFEIPL